MLRSDFITVGKHRIFCRVAGDGVRVLYLHGGWGHEVYPLPPVAARVYAPDRPGYGRSSWVEALPLRFHEAAAAEGEQLVAALGLERPFLWGHSDGAVLAATMALRAPDAYRGVILEALHLDRRKPASRQFFTDMAEDPSRFGARVAGVLRRDHGDAWEAVLRRGGSAWLAMAAALGGDLFDGRLGELRTPALVVHGADDPRSEPGELAQILAALPHARALVLEGAGHCPHAHPRSATAVATAVGAFLRDHAL